MITLEERIEFLSASSASILTQLNKLNRLKKQVRQAQATAFRLRGQSHKKNPAQKESERAGEMVRRLDTKYRRRGAGPV
jgi:hypothetical protein